VRQVRGSSSVGAQRASSQSVEIHDEDSETDVTAPPKEAIRTPRPSLKRRITRPSFMIDLEHGSQVGEYEIQEQIGEGAMGTVFSAVHPLIGKRVAIKVLKAELCANQATIDRFVHEAQAVNQIGHPNIVDVFSLGELADGRAYMVMEWLRGEDLKTRLARGPITVADACDILDGIARALDAAHAKQIVHRDLKPDNVFLHQVENGPLMVKLLDFGIAKLVRVTPGTEKTQTGNMLGTPKYISPEQARGIQVDHRSDIYSLGVMAYEMLAGRCPFQGETAMDVVVKHLSEPAPPLAQFAKVPKSLEQCVMAMLEKEPVRRPSLEAVRSILVDPSRRMTPLPTRFQSVLPIARSSPRWPILIGLLAAGGIGVLSWKLVTDHTEKAPEPTPSLAVKAQPEPPAPTAEPPPAGPTRVAEPAHGTLEIRVSGAKEAAILVDGKEWGRGASIKVELAPGDHQILVKPPGRPTITQKVSINAGQINTVAVVVPAPPARTAPRAKKDAKQDTPPVNRDDDLLTPKGHK
jgi:serine/threonine protein kinase